MDLITLKNNRTKIFVYKELIDLRASYDSLFHKAKIVLGKDPFSGHLFLFLNKYRTSCKCFYYDGTGFVILSKRLERGTFSKIHSLCGKKMFLTAVEFGLFFQGACREKRSMKNPMGKKGCSPR